MGGTSKLGKGGEKQVYPLLCGVLPAGPARGFCCGLTLLGSLSP
jgi:hypothetical protein